MRDSGSNSKIIRKRLTLKVFQDLARGYAPFFGMSDWTFIHLWGVRDPGNAAEVDVDSIQEIAYFYWNSRAPELRSAPSLKQTVLHEMAHCLTRHLRTVFLEMADRYVANEALRDEITHRFTDHEETLVGKISRAFYTILEEGKCMGPGLLPSEFPKKANKK